MNILIRIPRNLAISIAMLFGICVASGAYAEEPVNKSETSEKSAPVKSETSKKSKSAKTVKSSKGEDILIEMPVLILVPVDISNDVKNPGCWVTLYDGKDYQGEGFTITGPINLPTMVGPFGFNWNAKVHSLETGPKANLTIFDNSNFHDEDKFIGTSTRVPD